MEYGVRLSALATLPNRSLVVLKTIAERTADGPQYIPFNDLADDQDCSRHAIHDAVHALISAGLVQAFPGVDGAPGTLKIADSALIRLDETAK